MTLANWALNPPSVHMCTYATHSEFEGVDGMRRPTLDSMDGAMGRAGANSAIDVGCRITRARITLSRAHLEFCPGKRCLLSGRERATGIQKT